MKIIKTASGKNTIKISKIEWQSIGKKAGWKTPEQIREESQKFINAEGENAPSWYSDEMAKTTSNPDILRAILKKGHDDMVSNSAAMNGDCPPDALMTVLNRMKNDLVSAHAVKNGNCPPDGLARYLEIGLANDNSVNIVLNRDDCPSEAKKIWFQRVMDEGRFSSEDPIKVQEIREKVESI